MVDNKLLAIMMINDLCAKDWFGRPKSQALKAAGITKVPTMTEISKIVMNGPQSNLNAGIDPATIIAVAKLICLVSTTVICPIVQSL